MRGRGLLGGKQRRRRMRVSPRSSTADLAMQADTHSPHTRRSHVVVSVIGEDDSEYDGSNQSFGSGIAQQKRQAGWDNHSNSSHAGSNAATSHNGSNPPLPNDETSAAATTPRLDRANAFRHGLSSSAAALSTPPLNRRGQKDSAAATDAGASSQRVLSWGSEVQRQISSSDGGNGGDGGTAVAAALRADVRPPKPGRRQRQQQRHRGGADGAVNGADGAWTEEAAPEVTAYLAASTQQQKQKQQKQEEEEEEEEEVSMMRAASVGGPAARRTGRAKARVSAPLVVAHGAVHGSSTSLLSEPARLDVLKQVSQTSLPVAAVEVDDDDSLDFEQSDREGEFDEGGGVALAAGRPKQRNSTAMHANI